MGVSQGSSNCVIINNIQPLKSHLAVAKCDDIVSGVQVKKN